MDRYTCKQCGKEKDETEFTPSDLEYARQGKWTSCRKCHTARAVKYRRTLYGKMQQVYWRMGVNGTNRGHGRPRFSWKTFWKWCKKNGVRKIYDEWVSSGYEKGKAPSVDRIHSTRGYYLDNIQLCTWEWNYWKRARMDGLLFSGKAPF